MTGRSKVIQWVGRSRADIQEFPEGARREAGQNLRRVQRGYQPHDWKPMESVGPGACEIRIRTSAGGTVHYRVIYVARFDAAVYVLHAFEKKTRRTPQHDLRVAARRYREMMELLRHMTENEP